MGQILEKILEKIIILDKKMDIIDKKIDNIKSPIDHKLIKNPIQNVRIQDFRTRTP